MSEFVYRGPVVYVKMDALRLSQFASGGVDFFSVLSTLSSNQPSSQNSAEDRTFTLILPYHDSPDFHYMSSARSLRSYITRAKWRQTR